MPELGEIKRGREIGKKDSDHNFIWHACQICGKERWVAQRKGLPEKERCYPCAMEQCHKGHFGFMSPNWKGGRVISDGYFYIRLSPNSFFYSMTNKGGYVYEHRLVVAKALGRCLHSWEIVHHKGTKYPKGSVENKQDNRYPENLQLVSDDRHKQITILENKIARLEQRINKQDERITLLEAENIQLRTQLQLIES